MKLKISDFLILFSVAAQLVITIVFFVFYKSKLKPLSEDQNYSSSALLLFMLYYCLTSKNEKLIHVLSNVIIAPTMTVLAGLSIMNFNPNLQEDTFYADLIAFLITVVPICSAVFSINKGLSFGRPKPVKSFHDNIASVAETDVIIFNEL